MTDLPDATDITIVGAGPTGLALGHSLLKRGVGALIVDKQAEGVNTSRAAVIQARTLEVLEPLGLVPDLLAEGLKVPTLCIRDRDTVLMIIDFTHLATKYPTALMCPQDRTEAVLGSYLHRNGGTVHRPVEVLSIAPGDNGVKAILRSKDSTHSVQAKWLVGCDGAHSLVRQQAKIAFEGGDFDESFILADVKMDWLLGHNEINLFFSPAGLVVVAPLPGERFRIVTTMPEAPEHPNRDDVQTLIEARGPARTTACVREVIWSTRFRIQHRIAASARSGRVLLCGDAAHVHSPAGGQGMNTGIQDAVALADPLIAALSSGRLESLDQWAQTRRRIADKVITLTDRITNVATLSSRPSRLARNVTLSILGRFPPVRQAIARQLAELDND